MIISRFGNYQSSMQIFNSKITITDYLTWLDWLVCLAAVVFTIFVTWYGNRRTRITASNSEKSYGMLEYVLMGRSLSLPLFVITLVATWYGGIFGVTQIAFEQGIYNFVTQGIFWYLAYIIFAIFLVKRIRNDQALSIPDLIRSKFGNKSGIVAAGLTFLKTLPIAYVMSIGLFLQCLFPLDYMQATLLGVGLIVLYVSAGGLRSIVYSDIALFSIMLLGAVCVFGYSVISFSGFDILFANLEPSYFSPCGTKGWAKTLIWFFIACTSTFLSPAFYQRCLAAKNDLVARRGIFVATGVWIILDICTTGGAMYAKAVMANADPKHAYIMYGVQLLPPGWRGLFIASIAAAIIATIDAFLSLASSILSYDLPILKFLPQKTRNLGALLITSLLTIIIANHFEGNIELAWLVLKAYFAASLLIPLGFAYAYKNNNNERIFLINAIISCSSITLWRYYKLDHILDSFYFGCLISCMVFIGYFILKYLSNTFFTKNIAEY